MWKISLLDRLNLQPNFIYETIVTTYSEDKIPNAAPMGIILLNEQVVIISPFIATRTFKNILRTNCAVINFIFDLNLFFMSSFETKQPKLPLEFFEHATNVDAPLLKAAVASIQVRVLDIEKDAKRAKIKGEIICWNCAPALFFPLNRGYNLVLESLIHTTRILEFREDSQKVRPLVDLIKKYQSLIEKVAPIGEYIEIMGRIRKIIENEGLWS